MTVKEIKETKIRIHIIAIQMHGTQPNCLCQEGKKKENLAKTLVIVTKSVRDTVNHVNNFIARPFLH